MSTTGDQGPAVTAAGPTPIQVTPAAEAAVEDLRSRHGPLLFVESHGCCDNSAPMCLPVAEYPTGPGDVEIARVAGCPYYVDARTLRYRGRGPITVEYELDVEPGLAEGLSLAPPGGHFVLRANIQ